jgi:hypothetical protein
MFSGEDSKIPMSDLMLHNIWLMIAPPEGLFSSIAYIKAPIKVVNITPVEEPSFKEQSSIAYIKAPLKVVNITPMEVPIGMYFYVNMYICMYIYLIYIYIYVYMYLYICIYLNKCILV